MGPFLRMKTTILFLAIIAFAAELASQTPTQNTKQLVGVSKKGKTEFSPTISADGRTLIFETQNGEKWELLQSNLGAQGEWSEPIPLKAINDKCNFIGGPSLSYDGNTLYYTAFIENVTASEDIFYSTRLGQNEWTEPKSIGLPINTDETYEGFPSISADGNDLYFIRINEENGYNKKAKEDCFKIYVSHKQSDGSWGAPEALPPVVNQGCERDPRIMADNHTLIFSSIRPEGIGKYDLYQTRLRHDGTWSTVVPLAFINSVENDQSPCISASGNTMYYYSDGDIYEITIPQEFRQLINVTVHGTVRAGKNNIPVKASINVRQVSSGEVFTSESNAQDGLFSIVVAAGNAYEVTFKHAEYLPARLELDYTQQRTYLEAKKDITLSDSFTMVLNAQDKDLKTPVKAFVKVTEMGSGKVVFADSVFDNPPSLTLETKQTYQVGFWAPGYPPVEKQLVFAADNSAEVTRYTETIEHEKVSVVADVTDISTGGKKRAKVTYKNENSDEVIIADAGEIVNLRKGDRYQVMTHSDKGLSYSIQTITAGEGTAKENESFKVNLPVAELNVGAKLNLNHIYFESNSWKLSDASALELNNIVELLQTNPNITIEISAHTDDVGAHDFNLDLSHKRAASVIEYLKKKGISHKQLVGKGYGKTKPIASNETEAERARNRRVELIVVAVK